MSRSRKKTSARGSDLALAEAMAATIDPLILLLVVSAFALAGTPMSLDQCTHMCKDCSKDKRIRETAGDIWSM